MLEQFLRNLLLLGQVGIDKLSHSKVLIFGIGGVGSYSVEALARSGIGKITLVDADIVCVTNINRQLEALYSTVGRPKVEVYQERIYDINPQCEVTIYNEFVTVENVDKFIESDTSYIIDAIDTISSKLKIIEKALTLKIPVISSMGMGNRLDPTKIRIADICETSNCALARVMRRELRKKEIVNGVKVVYSTELAKKHHQHTAETTIGSLSFVPGVAGLFMASEVIKDIININE
ncbi:MAG: tRNA cyclic N6-threonylcarbamoyladenosine(37) synthase TcdA [Firmicutes bacterium HGW-Firmicutes-12]|nr:MAG: tRNA cyclic N6-threonylcarbamoyladenosine(37) synthase TcdA [Firmicutes bacterium HGW-Firmicutes-12]